MYNDKCHYRNCEGELYGRIDKKYCCSNHRKMEAMYVKREKVRHRQEKQTIVDMIKQHQAIEALNPTEKDKMEMLYWLMYGK